MDLRPKILAVLPYIMAAGAFLGARSVSFESALTPDESAILNFQSNDVVEFEARTSTPLLLKGLSSPIRFVKDVRAGTSDNPPPSAGPGAPSPAPGVTMIVLSDTGGVAIINGVIAEEGDYVNGELVARIEKSRVLVKGTNQRWIYMEGSR